MDNLSRLLYHKQKQKLTKPNPMLTLSPLGKPEKKALIGQV